MPKSTKRQNIGNEAESRGSAYQVFSTTFLALRMLLYGEYQWVRQNGEGPIDDIQAKDANGRDNFFQCKTTRNASKKEIIAILTDFYNQYLEDLNNTKTDSKYILFSLYNPPSLNRILELTNEEPQNGQSHDEFIQNKLSKTDKVLYDQAFKKLQVIQSRQKVESLKQTQANISRQDSVTKIDLLSKDEFIKFLKHIEIWSYPFKAIKDDLYNELEGAKYPKYAYHILSTTLLYEWLSRDIKKRDVEDLMTNFGIELLTSDIKSVKPQKKKKSLLPAKAGFILFKVDKKFEEKLDFMLKIISKNKFSKSAHQLIIEALLEDNTLSWHFLKNLKTDTWFSELKDNLIKAISEQEEDGAVKFQLLNYLEKCADKYSDEIVPIISVLEKNTQNYNILSSLIKTLGKLSPKQTDNVTQLFNIFSKLAEHQHPWVRREIPKAIITFADRNIDKVIEILRQIFFYNPPSQDVTQGSPTLALTFQGTDNENWVFEEAINALSELLRDPKFTEKAHILAIDIEKQVLKEDEKLHNSEQGITLDYSSIWLSDKSFDSERLEYNHDKKERVALEIEKALNELTPTNNVIVTNILSMLIKEKYEVFYLIVIKVLVRNIKIYMHLAESLVFDTKLWLVYNIRNYFLQTLITNYFQVNDDANLAKFVAEIDQINIQDPKKTLYTKQDLYISIPENKRDKETTKKLAEVSSALKTKPEISKPFVVTTWSGTRPDITVEELKTKSKVELVQIMVDSSTRKRAASYDIAPVFAQLIDINPNLLKDLLVEMAGKKLEPDFSGEMVEAYTKKVPQDIVGIADLIGLLEKENTWARIEIARYFDEICRKKEIQDYDETTICKIREALLVLTKDNNPGSDDTIKSSNPRPDDAITRGINSVRGIATEALVAFYHYFPTDKKAAERIIELASDNTNAVKATLIYHLRYLIGKDFRLCENIINKFRNKRDPEIDFALIHFFAQLDCDKFIKYQDFIKLLFNNTNEQISEDLGELIGYRYINGCDIQALLDDVIGNRRGTKHTIRSLAFVFESQMGNMIGNQKDKQIASYLKRLMSPQYDFEVVERAAFVFQRDEIEPEQFEFFDQNGLTSELLLNKLNIPAQSHLVDYLHKCVEKNISIDRCVELLHKQITTVDAILSDHLIVGKIAQVVSKLIKMDLSSKTKDYLSDIFNAGLERGWDEFYAIYYDLRKK